MDDLLSTSITEIALEGLQGCNLSTLCERLRKHTNLPILDEYVKNVLWNMLKNSPELIFFTEQPSDKSEDYSPLSMAGYVKPVLRKELTSNERNSLELNEHNENSIIIVALFELRTYVLGINETDKQINETMYCMLEYIGRSRREGALQCDISKDLNLDNRSVFNYLKKLCVMKLIHREQVYERKMITNRVWLTRFKFEGESQTDESFSEYLQIRDNAYNLVIEWLQQAKDHVLLDRDVRAKLGFSNEKKDRHRWDRIRNNILKSGKIEIIQVKVDGKIRKCLRLIDNEDGEKDETTVKRGTFIELPQIFQMYRKIAIHGNEGILHPKLHSFIGMSNKLSLSFCKNLKDEYGVVQSSERIKSNRTHRLTVKNKVDLERAKEWAKTDDLEVETKKEEKKKKMKEEVITIEHGTPEDSKAIEYAIASYGKKNHYITKEFNEKCKHTIALLREKKVISNIDIRRALNITDGKTIKRLVTFLSDNKLLTIVNMNIPLLTGSHKIVPIYLLPGISKDDPLVMNFKKQLEGKQVIVRTKDKNEVKEVQEEMEVDRLDIPIQPSPKKNVSKYSFGEVTYCAIRNGYICAKMLRIKAFHIFLWDMAFNSEVEPIQTKFHITDVLNEMTIGLYLQIIGLVKDIDGIHNYVNHKISELPKEVKSILFNQGSKRRIAVSRISSFLEFLKNYKLIIPEYSEDQNAQDKMHGLKTYIAFELVPTATIETRNNKFTFSFKDHSQVELYWKYLEETCKKNFTSLLWSDNEEDDVEDKPEFKTSEWTEIKHYTIGRLRTFEAQYKINPQPTAQECVKIAKETRTPIEHVILYFFRHREKILQQTVKADDGELIRKRKNSKGPKPPKKKIKRTILGDLEYDNVEMEDSRIIITNTKRPRLDVLDKSLIRGHTTAYKQTKKMQTQKKDQNDVMEDIEDEKAIEIEPVIRTRHKWKPEEDLRLLEELAKIRDLDKDGNFVKPIEWKVIADKLGKRVNQCRTRWSNLQKKDEWPVRAVKFAIMHRKANPNSTIPIIDILRNCRDNVNNEQTIDIPESIEDFEKYFETFGSQEKQFQIGTAIPDAKLLALENLIKIILFTPEEDYHVYPASTLLKNFSSDEIQSCISRLRLQGVLSKAKSRNLRIRKFQLSQKFSSHLEQIKFPKGIFDEATDFAKRMKNDDLNEEEEDFVEEELQNPIRRFRGEEDEIEDLIFNPFCSSGQVAATLSMVANDELQLIPQLFEQTEDKIENNPQQKKSKGVASLLANIGAIGLGEDTITGSDSKRAKNITLPKWDIQLENTIEPQLFTRFGTKIKREEREKKRKAPRIRYMNVKNIEFNIEKQENLDRMQYEENIEEPNMEFESVPHNSPEIQSSHEEELDPEIAKKLEEITKDYPELYIPIKVLLQTDQEEEAIIVKEYYEKILETKEEGRSISTFEKEYKHEFGNKFEIPLQILQNFELIDEIDFGMEKRFVARKYSDIYTFTPYIAKVITETPPVNEEQPQVPPPNDTSGPISLTDHALRLKNPQPPPKEPITKTIFEPLPDRLIAKPWISLNGEMNVDFINRLRRVILEVIIRKPGITEKNLITQFSEIGQNTLLPILENMELDKVIYKKAITYKQPSLFDEFEVFDVPENYKSDDPTEIVDICYFATVDSMLRV